MNNFIQKKIETSHMQEIKHNVTRQDVADIKSELSRTIYIVGLIQFITIVGSVLAIVTFMLNK